MKMRTKFKSTTGLPFMILLLLTILQDFMRTGVAQDPNATLPSPKPKSVAPKRDVLPLKPNFRPQNPKLELVKIPTGRFMMGSIYGPREEPVHEVSISYSFYIGKYEVTQAQWKSVMGNNPSYHEECDNCPVEAVSWHDAQRFLQRLNQMSDGNTYRLPTEAEWEYACRAGTTGSYAGALSEMGWYEENDGDRPHPVGLKRANPWGLFDMHGNVWEWCEDRFHHTYNEAPADGSAWLSRGVGKLRVRRGGGVGFPATFLRSAERSPVSSDSRIGNTGFRVVAIR
jgi:formylglycine-generating enzyme required for sulfatase activity